MASLGKHLVAKYCLGISLILRSNLAMTDETRRFHSNLIVPG
jgi:hypothetical protein